MTLRAKNTVAGLGLVLLCLLLAACVEIQMRFDLRSEGSGTAEWTIEIPKATAESLGLTTEKVKAEMLKDRQFQRPGVKVTTGRAANGNETVTVSMPFSSVQELASNDMSFEFQKTPDGRQCTFRVNARGAQAAMPLRVQVEVRMPGRITASNADSVSGNVARFNSLFRPDGVWAQSETAGFLTATTLAVLAGTGAAVVVFLLVLVWTRKKRVAPAAAVAAPAPGAVYCRQCGADNRVGTKFCRNCGAPLAAAPPPAANCPKCGAAVAPGKKFCHACGAPVGTAAPAPAPISAAPPPPPPAWTPPAPKPAKGSAMLIALVASLVLLLIAIVLLVYKLMSQNQAAAPPVSAPAQTAETTQPPAVPETPGQPPVSGQPESQPGALPGAGTQPAQQPVGTPAAAGELGRPSPMPGGIPAQAAPAAPARTPPQPSSPSAAGAQQPAAGSPAAPVTPAPTQVAPPAPVKPAYSGPRSGVILWSGQLERNGLIEISGATASGLPGSLRGELPGVPVIVEVEPKDVGVAEAPSPQNGWKRLVLRSRNRRMSVVTIKWTVIQ